MLPVRDSAPRRLVRSRAARLRVEQLESRDLLSIAALPYPDHIVIAIEENHSYQQIIGSAAAPYINSLVPTSANFTQSYALTHPSQPNYLHLFSGANQGVTNDNCLTSPLSTRNLGASLLQAGYPFAGYSESLPAIGSTVCTSGAYARKHNPWVNWQGGASNAIPPTANQRWSDFPANYSALPTISYVVPNQDNDMHNGSDPTRITRGDTWLYNNLNNLVQWTYANNSLFILTFDEDNGSAGNRIPTLFLGPMVAPGTYSQRITHHDLLRTLEDMYALPYAGASATATPITNVWYNPWQEADIGSVGAAGWGFDYADYYYYVAGAGAGIGGTADAFHYVYQPLHADGWIFAQVSGLPDTGAGAKAGVMIRESLAAGSKEATLALTPANGAQLVTRTTTGGASTITNGPAVGTPSYLYMQRTGDTIDAWVYNTATNWVYVGSSTVAMAQDVLVGLAVTSGAVGTLNTSSFDTVYIGSGSSPGPGGPGLPGLPPQPASAGANGLRIDSVERLLAIALPRTVGIPATARDRLDLEPQGTQSVAPEHAVRAASRPEAAAPARTLPAIQQASLVSAGLLVGCWGEELFDLG